MPSRKRTRTTVSDRLISRDHKKVSQTRWLMAEEAARIMATQGQCNYRLAKQKAAQRLGVRSSLALPSNVEIENALRAYQVFYGGEKHLEHVKRLREIAVRVMQSLEKFSPRLVGPVLEGTADQHAGIILHLFSDPPDAVAIHLMDKGLNFRHEQRKIRWHDGGHHHLPLLVTAAENVTVELALFNNLDLRQAPPNPVDGRPQKRAPLAEVKKLLTDT